MMDSLKDMNGSFLVPRVDVGRDDDDDGSALFNEMFWFCDDHMNGYSCNLFSLLSIRYSSFVIHNELLVANIPPRTR